MENRQTMSHKKYKKGSQRIVRKIIAMILVVTTFFSMSINSFAANYPSSSDGYSVPATITVKVGQSKKLSVKQPSTSYGNVSFQYNPNYVTTSNYSAGSYWGKPAEITFTGKKAGTFYSYVTIKTHKYRYIPFFTGKTITLACKVKVVAAAKKNNNSNTSSNSGKKKIPLQSINLSKSTTTLGVGKNTKIKVNYVPSNTTARRSVTWTSSNTNVATVKNGVVTGKSTGFAVINAKVGKHKANCWVFVTKNGGGSNGGNSNGNNNGNNNGNKNNNTNNNSNNKNNTGSTSNVADAYTKLNEFRTTKSNQWYWNSDNKTKTYTYNLKALTRDPALEKIAQKRAQEQWTQYYVNGVATHNRPDGSSCWTAYSGYSSPCGECLAWGYTTSDSVINAWAENDEGYAGQGHRRIMLSSQATKVGIAKYTKDGKTCWALSTGY